MKHHIRFIRRRELAGEKPNNVDIHSKFENRKIENGEKSNARPMEKFLGSLSKGTKKSYRRGLELFIEFYGNPYLEEIREQDKQNQKLGNEEVEKINRMSKRKQQEWLESETSNEL